MNPFALLAFLAGLAAVAAAIVYPAHRVESVAVAGVAFGAAAVLVLGLVERAGAWLARRAP